MRKVLVVGIILVLSALAGAGTIRYLRQPPELLPLNRSAVQVEAVAATNDALYVGAVVGSRWPGGRGQRCDTRILLAHLDRALQQTKPPSIDRALSRDRRCGVGVERIDVQGNSVLVRAWGGYSATAWNDNAAETSPSHAWLQMTTLQATRAGHLRGHASRRSSRADRSRADTDDGHSWLLVSVAPATSRRARLVLVSRHLADTRPVQDSVGSSDSLDAPDGTAIVSRLAPSSMRAPRWEYPYRTVRGVSLSPAPSNGVILAGLAEWQTGTPESMVISQYGRRGELLRSTNLPRSSCGAKSDKARGTTVDIAWLPWSGSEKPEVAVVYDGNLCIVSLHDGTARPVLIES